MSDTGKIHHYVKRAAGLLLCGVLTCSVGCQRQEAPSDVESRSVGSSGAVTQSVPSETTEVSPESSVPSAPVSTAASQASRKESSQQSQVSKPVSKPSAVESSLAPVRVVDDLNPQQQSEVTEVQESSVRSEVSVESEPSYEPLPEPSSEPSPEPSPEPSSEPSPEPSPEPSVEVPSEPSAETGSERLTSRLNSAGYTMDDLQRRDCRQIITVNAYGSDAVLSFFQCDEAGNWEEIPELQTDGFVGRLGVSRSSYEGSRMTPFGLFGVGDGFYQDDVPETGLNLFRVTEDTYWVDDPSSAYYNQRVEGTANKDWNSAEHMIEYPRAYHYGFVIEFNTSPVVPGKGSAIFFHVNNKPTAGCVAVSEDMVLRYLSRLDSSSHPCILIQ